MSNILTFWHFLFIDLGWFHSGAIYCSGSGLIWTLTPRIRWLSYEIWPNQNCPTSNLLLRSTDSGLIQNSWSLLRRRWSGQFFIRQIYLIGIGALNKNIFGNLPRKINKDAFKKKIHSFYAHAILCQFCSEEDRLQMPFYITREMANWKPKVIYHWLGNQFSKIFSIIYP